MKNHNCENREIAKPLYTGCVEVDEKIWFWDSAEDGLFCADLQNRIAKPVVLNEKKNDSNICAQYSNVCLVDRKLIFAPFCSDEILIYDLDKNACETIELPKMEWNSMAVERGRFFGVVSYMNYVFFVGYWCTYLVRLDLSTQTIKYINLLDESNKSKWGAYYHEAGKILKNDNPGEIKPTIFTKYAEEYNGKIYIPIRTCGQMLVVDCISMVVNVIEIAEVKYGFTGISISDNKIWLAPVCSEEMHSPVACMNAENGEIVYYDCYPKGVKLSENIAFVSIQSIQDKAILLPSNAKQVVVIDEKTGTMTIDESITNVIGCDGNETPRVTFFRTTENGLMIYGRQNRNLVKWDNALNKYLEIWISFSEEYLQKKEEEIIDRQLNESGLLFEGEYVINDFLKYCINK